MHLGLDRLWLFLALALPALASLIVPLAAVDLAYHVRAGELILSTGAIPDADTFTFTAFHTPWLDQQWLAQVVFAWLHRAGGWELIAIVRAAMIAVVFGFVAAAAIARGASARTAAILSLLAFALAAPALAMRPQLIGILAFGALLWLVAGRRRHPGRLWLAPLLVVIWANSHGSVVLAPLLFGYAWLEDVVEGHDQRRALVVLLAGTLATLVNPFGISVWGYATGLGANPEVTSQVSEWQRTTPFTVPGLLFYVSALAVAAVAFLGRNRVSKPAWLWLAALFALGAWTVRGLAWWPLGAVVVIAAALPAPAIPRPVRANALNSVVVAALVVVLALALPWWRPANALTGREGLLAYAPSRLALALRERTEPRSRVFAEQTWGSWLEWAVPDARYFVDSRIELFGADAWREYGTIASGAPGATDLLDRYQVELVVVETGSPLRDRLRSEPGWAEVYADGDGVIAQRGAAVQAHPPGPADPAQAGVVTQ